MNHKILLPIGGLLQAAGTGVMTLIGLITPTPLQQLLMAVGWGILIIYLQKR